MDLQREYDFYITRKLLKGIIPDDDAIESVMINNPHDKLIKIVFSDRQEAVTFFQNKLPQKIVKIIDWDTLELEGSIYILMRKCREVNLIWSIVLILKMVEVNAFCIYCLNTNQRLING
jgi:hypothetical protein